VDLEVTPGPHNPPLTGPPNTRNTVVQVAPQLAILSARVLNASGQPTQAGQPLPRGRAVLQVTMDALAGQRAAGSLAGLAGFKVWLDNTELVAVPTAVNGPGVGGTWLIAFDPSQATGGPHLIDVRAYGTQHGVAYGEALANFLLGS
jgi:hypothetical protein